VSQLPAILVARAEFYDRVETTTSYLSYVRRHGIDIGQVTDFAGATGVIEIVDCGNGRFDWSGPGTKVMGFVCEALDADGETVVDLVAWPIDRPMHVLTMLGRAALVGMWAAMNPATFYMDKPLIMYRTPLEWLTSGCRGAAVVHARRAGRAFLDIPGPILAQDPSHARTLLAIARSVVDERQIRVRQTSISARVA
jgi:hypothetical protein